ITIDIPANSFTGATNIGNTASDTLTVLYVDTTPPTVTAVATATGTTTVLTSVNNVEPFDVTLTFSEPVSFLGDPIQVTNGGFTTSGNADLTSGSLGYTITVTPDGLGDIVITALAGTFQGSATNVNLAAVILTLRYAPEVTSFTGPDSVNNRNQFNVMVTFSENVVILDTIDVKYGMRSVGSSVNGVYTLPITPNGMGDIVITFPAGSLLSNTGIANTAAAILTVLYNADTTPPTATLTGPAYIRTINTAFTVNLKFTEDVEELATSAEMLETIKGYFTVTGGVVSTLNRDPMDDSLYVVRVLPTAAGVTTIVFKEGSAMDASGNPNPASNTLPVTYDSVAPMVTQMEAPETVNSQAPFEVTLTFTEAVTGLEAAEIEVRNGAAELSGSGANYVLTITPDGMGDIEITIPADVAVDAAGNNNAAFDLVSVTYVADAIAPTVTLAGPDTLSNLEPFAVTLTFSEVVTGLEVADIEVANGAVTTLSGSGANYVLTLTPTGNGDLTVTIPAAAAMDAAANGNAASATLAVVNTIVADTQAAIAGFMLDRANNLARNQPGLTRFLQGTGCSSSLSTSNTDTTGTANGCVSYGHAWGELSNTWSSDSSYALVTLGAHGFVGDNLIIGGLAQFDAVDDDARNITGQGWLVGPYFVSKPAGQNMVFDGRLLYGQTDNDISPLGSYEDSFDTDRYLAQLRATGQYGYRTMTLMPLFDLTYLQDTQLAYTDTLSNLIDEQGIDLTQMTFGVDFRLPLAVVTGQFDLTGGLSGTYSEVNDGEADFEGGRGRVELGLNYASDNGTTFTGGIFYDG
ncbi:MAG: Ig-like domain-containing protein, partial [Candidatus Azotimanducaceae bacterium WSBS_2022_MAG_OTU7]